MSKAAQLKRKAAEFEQKRQYDKALSTYVQAAEAATGSGEEIDIPLYNRIGDLHLRLGDTTRAVEYYEKAVDLYSEGGFFNNAIALCNKVLRHVPSRTGIYYKLGRISARKGFTSDAKQNFLEYATRVERAGDPDEAFRALKEFADLCPGQDDVRLMLAEQLARANRHPEALEQLQIVYAAMLAEHRSAEAAATLERIRAIDPSYQPTAAHAARPERHEGLVFLDVDSPFAASAGQESTPAVQGAAPAASPNGSPAGSPVGPRTVPPTAPAAPRAPERPRREAPDAASSMPLSRAEEATTEDSPLAGLTGVGDPMQDLADAASVGADSGFEPTSLAPDYAGERGAHVNADASHFDIVEPMSFGDPDSASGGGTGESAPNMQTSSDFTTSSRQFDDPEQPPRAASDAEPEPAADTLAGAVAGYVGTLATDVGNIEGGLPADLGLLPIEAIDEEQSAALGAAADSLAHGNGAVVVESLVPEPPTPPVSAQSITDESDFVDLQTWLAETEPPPNPRMTGEDEQEEGKVQSDFNNMLETFKRGVAQNVDESDAESHYDLGVAYREMGLLEEAIAQFQKTLRAETTPDRRIRAQELLAQCFLDRDDYQTAVELLRSAVAEGGVPDARMVGVLYLLGYASERLNAWSDAAAYYRRVFAVDIHFRDIGDRLRRAEQMA